MVTVDAAFRTRDGGHLSLPECQAELPKLLADEILDPWFLLLRLTITDGAGDMPGSNPGTATTAELVVVDDFEPAIQNLCLKSIPPLAAGDEYRYDYWAHRGGLRFVPESEQVTVSGMDGIEMTPVSFDRRALAEALAGFAGTAMQVMAQLAAADDRYDAGALPYFRQLGDQAQAALTATS